METYTGLTGMADKLTRLIGKRFFVIETGPCELLVTQDETEANRILKEEEWHSWVAMIARNEQKAKTLFYDAHDQWRAKYDPD